MGWNAKFRSGIIVRQQDGIIFSKIDLNEIQEMWLDGLEKISIDRIFCPGFIEFVQFETAITSNKGSRKIGEYIGWTNGESEFIIGITKEKHNFHPQSSLKEI
ncbi:hypothetical protein ACFL7D_10820 [candidate division KSB1 bacterium]